MILIVRLIYTFSSLENKLWVELSTPTRRHISTNGTPIGRDRYLANIWPTWLGFSDFTWLWSKI